MCRRPSRRARPWEPAADRVRWHLIGHLQTNKINKALQVFDVFQTVDSLETARAIDVRAARLDRVVPVYIEVNSAVEESKSGVAPDLETLAGLARGVCALAHVRLEGLMTMGPLSADEDEVRAVLSEKPGIFLTNCARLNCPEPVWKRFRWA